MDAENDCGSRAALPWLFHGHEDFNVVNESGQADAVFQKSRLAAPLRQGRGPVGSGTQAQAALGVLLAIDHAMKVALQLTRALHVFNDVEGNAVVVEALFFGFKSGLVFSEFDEQPFVRARVQGGAGLPGRLIARLQGDDAQRRKEIDVPLAAGLLEKGVFDGFFPPGEGGGWGGGHGWLLGGNRLNESGHLCFQKPVQSLAARGPQTARIHTFVSVDEHFEQALTDKARGSDYSHSPSVSPHSSHQITVCAAMWPIWQA